MSPLNAVLVGHALVNGVTILIIGACVLSANALEVRWTIGVLAGGVLSWGWWSLMIPRWRRWAASQGADPEQTQRLGERTLLLWEKGSVLEKTEFRGKRGE